MISRLIMLLTATAMAVSSPVAASDLTLGGQYAPPGVECGPSDDYSIVAPVAIELLIGPGDHYQPLAVVPPCQRLPIILCEYRTGWCRTQYGRYDGWLFEPDLRDILHYPLGH